MQKYGGGPVQKYNDAESSKKHQDLKVSTTICSKMVQEQCLHFKLSCLCELIGVTLIFSKGFNVTGGK